MEENKNNQVELLKMTTTMFEMENTQIGINSKLTIAEEKMNNLKA